MDAPEIPDDEVLLRRLVPDWIVPGEQGRMRISSAAFKHREMSILFLTLLRQQRRQIEDALTGHPGDSLCSITVGLARKLGQEIAYDTGPPHDPAHGLVMGKKTQAIASQFARAAQWVIPSEAPIIKGD
jgi:hypothetical protein